MSKSTLPKICINPDRPWCVKEGWDGIGLNNRNGFFISKNQIRIILDSLEYASQRLDKHGEPVTNISDAIRIIEDKPKDPVTWVPCVISIDCDGHRTVSDSGEDNPEIETRIDSLAIEKKRAGLGLEGTKDLIWLLNHNYIRGTDDYNHGIMLEAILKLKALIYEE